MITRQIWGTDANRNDGNIIQAIALFLSTHVHADYKRLVSVVQKQYTPGSLLAAAKSMNQVLRMTIPEAAYLTMVKAYNTKLMGKKKLDETPLSKKGRGKKTKKDDGRTDGLD